MPSEIWWGFWRDYPKVTIDVKEYAQVGDWLYTMHAVERCLRSGRRTIGDVPKAWGEGGGHMFHEKARGVPLYWVEEVIKIGAKSDTVVNQELRTIHTYGELKVVTTRDGRIVITVQYGHEN
jgi:hypothetical protein